MMTDGSAWRGPGGDAGASSGRPGGATEWHVPGAAGTGNGSPLAIPATGGPAAYPSAGPAVSAWSGQTGSGQSGSGQNWSGQSGSGQNWSGQNWSGQTGQAPGSSALWWADAAGDPWRDPSSPSAIVVRAPGSGAPEPPKQPTPAGGRPLGTIFLVAVVTALLAGALGGTLGYVFASRNLGRGTTVLGGGSGGGGASPGALAQRAPESLAGVVQRVLPSVVTVKIGTANGYSLGSGFIVSGDGFVITNDHVVEGITGAATVTLSDGTNVSARLVGVDEESDVAVLKADKDGLTPVQFGDSSRVAVGDPVLAFGSPLALSNTVTYGIISALDRTMEADEPGGPTRYYAAIQTDAAVNHGNSGGPLVDAAGRVIGINSVIRSLASDSSDGGNIGLAFAIPINQAKRIASDIIDTGHSRRTVIGAQVNDGYANPNGGVQLSDVTAGGPAANAGLRSGDVLIKIDGVPLTEPTDLIALVRKYAPGESVNVEYRRGSAALKSVRVTLAADAK
jgi:putative serine protease PepD